MNERVLVTMNDSTFNDKEGVVLDVSELQGRFRVLVNNEIIHLTCDQFTIISKMKSRVIDGVAYLCTTTELEQIDNIVKRNTER